MTDEEFQILRKIEAIEIRLTKLEKDVNAHIFNYERHKTEY